jgi:NTP pyrophosphatase (non-canonical NTP hydrolase)
MKPKNFKTLKMNIEIAKKKHPEATFTALVEEVGEVARCIEEKKDPTFELYDVATVAIRLIEQWEDSHEQ